MEQITQIPSNFDYASMEDETLEYLNKIRIVKKINERHETDSMCIFMEGPPFISGSGKTDDSKKKQSGLHIGHCLVSEIKSCVMKYLQMRGFRCDMYTGTDNHGLPIETFVSKQLQLQSPNAIREYGVENFNRKCKETILEYETLWDPVYESIGRFVDLTHRYKTMDKNYMESVFWVFKTLWKKNLIYRGWKVMPYSYRAGTVLSNFEASQCYQEVNDDTTYVYFPIVGKEKTGFVAWTTTPWTLPCNIALCLNPNGEYVTVTDQNDRKYIVHKGCVRNLCIDIKHIKNVIPCGTGNDLTGIEYIPPFNYYPKRKYVTISDPFVEMDGKIGTGIVHIACGFGEIDYDVSMKKGIVTRDDIIELCPVDDNGCFTDPITDYKGKLVFDTNQDIIVYLKTRDLLVRKEKYKHSYPHSDRTGEPLIYRAMTSYFVRVTAIKDKLLEMNSKVTWMPEHIGKGRFHEWLSNARDWSISRSRFFGTPIPLWVTDDGTDALCIGSIDELMEYANLKERPIDLHPEFLDKIIIERDGKMYKRIPDVFDCWFESGSVPYGQIHYPFENGHIFDDREYLSDFVCEGIDQTRGWFYTLLVLSTALFGKPAFKNVICTGLILDKDGKKMSKRFGNYKDPYYIIRRFGSDAMRMYLLGSSAVQADDLNFDEENIIPVKQKLMQWQSGIHFFIEHYLSFMSNGYVFDKDLYKRATNIFDQWILLRMNEVVRTMNYNLGRFDVNPNVKVIYEFINDYTNWYTKLNRLRLKGIVSKEDWSMSLSVAYHIIMVMTKCLVPYTPFLSECVYKHIKQYEQKQEESVHLCTYPTLDEYDFSEKLLVNIGVFKEVVQNIRAIRMRESSTASIRRPLKKVYIAHDNDDVITFINMLSDVIKKEINCDEIEITKATNYMEYMLKPKKSVIAKKYRVYMKNMDGILQMITSDMMREMYNSPEYVITINIPDKYIVEKGVNQLTFTRNELEIIPKTSGSFGCGFISEMFGRLMIAIDTRTDVMLEEKFIVGQFCRNIQHMRKSNSIHPWDEVVIVYDTQCEQLERIIGMNIIQCQKHLKCTVSKEHVMCERDTIVCRNNIVDIISMNGTTIGTIRMDMICVK